MDVRVRHGRDPNGLVNTVDVVGDVAATPVHAHASSIVGLVVDGRRTLALPDGRLVLCPGDGFLVPPEVAHAWAAAEGGHHRVMALDVSGLAVPRWRAGMIRDAGWRAAFDRLFEAVGQGESQIVGAVAALVDLTGRLLPGDAAPVVAARPVRAARRVLTERLDRPLDLAELGARVGLSPFHLHRLFRRIWGLTPGEFRLEARLRGARRALLAGAPIAEVAAEFGFSDQSHLNRVFRRSMGVPPGVWMRQLRRGSR